MEWKEGNYTDHNFTTVTTPATCGKDGVMTYTCSVCEASYTEAIAATGAHNYEEEIVAPTPSSAGYTKHTCSVCGDTYNDTFVDYVPEGPVTTPVESFTYTETETAVTITGFVGKETVVIIPAEINGKPVTKIGTSAFQAKTKITSVTIPASVTEIATSAFRACSGLTEVVLNEGLTKIGQFAFNGAKLARVVLPSTVKTIEQYAFYNVKTLGDIDLANVQTIGGGAFSGCTALGSTAAGIRIVLPETVKSLGVNAFQNCTSIVRVDWYAAKISASGSADQPAFQGCTGINEVRIYPTAVNLPSFMFYKSSKVAEGKGIATLRFMSGTQAATIGDYAFYQQRIGTINLPSTMVKVGREAFRNNNLLRALNLGTGVNNIGQLAFSFCNGIETVTIPGNVKTIYAYAFRACAALKSVTIEEGVDYISSYAFADCKSLQEVRLPSTLTKINGGITYNTSTTIYYYEGTFADEYLHSKSAKISKEKLVSLGEYIHIIKPPIPTPKTGL